MASFFRALLSQGSAGPLPSSPAPPRGPGAKRQVRGRHVLLGVVVGSVVNMGLIMVSGKFIPPRGWARRSLHVRGRAVAPDSSPSDGPPP